jgi:hypothetical protein
VHTSRFIVYLLAAAAVAQPPALPRFSDVTAPSGVRFLHRSSKTSEKYLPESMGAGVALLDYDNDGLLDLFFVNGAALKTPMAPGDRPDKRDPRYWNRLYRNTGKFTFTDVTEAAGLRGEDYGMGAAAGDYNRDGRVDLYVTGVHGNRLYRNQGNGSFRDVTEASGTGLSGWSAGAAFLDIEGDGDLDLFVARYLDWDFSNNIWCGAKQPGYRSYCHPDQYPAVTHALLRNNGNGTFTDVSKESGIAAGPGKGLGVAINDYDDDGRPDIFVANDSFPQQLFHNRGGGAFREIGLDLGLAYDDDGKTFAGMGADFRDYDNDGRPDIFVNALALQRYALFRNTGKAFDYHSGPSRLGQISRLRSGWGSGFFDYDNDGWRDLFVAQGHVMDNIELTQPQLRYLEPPLLLRNRAGKFEDVSGASGDIFQKPIAGRGAAFGDLDNDGWLDIVMNVNDGPAVILRNQGTPGVNWLTVDLGVMPGPKVRVKTAGGSQYAYATTAGSYLSASDSRVHLGLGAARSALEVEVRWPSGRLTTLRDVKAGAIFKVKEPESASLTER